LQTDIDFILWSHNLDTVNYCGHASTNLPKKFVEHVFVVKSLQIQTKKMCYYRPIKHVTHALWLFYLHSYINLMYINLLSRRSWKTTPLRQKFQETVTSDYFHFWPMENCWKYVIATYHLVILQQSCYMQEIIFLHTFLYLLAVAISQMNKWIYSIYYREIEIDIAVCDFGDFIH
jgi:hypothetical protein